MSGFPNLRRLVFCSCLLLGLLASAPEARSPQDLAGRFERLESLQQQLAELDAQPEPTLEVLRTRREEQARMLLAAIDRVEAEIQIALTGHKEEAFEAVFEDPPTDLQSELQEFFDPLLDLLRSATAQSRETEALRRELSGLTEQRDMARSALESLDAAHETSDERRVLVDRRVGELRRRWSKRLEDTESRIGTLEARLAQLQKAAAEAETDVSAPVRFLRERGLTLLLGALAGSITWLVLTLLGSAASRASRNQRLGRLREQGLSTTRLNASLRGRGLGVPVRALRIFYRVFTLGAAILVTLAVFNARHDWVLLGCGALLLFALAWTLVKSLPEAVEQIRTLLNLGSVQEGERLRFDGIPWRVSVLDFYTVLENPALEGGDLTLPVRDLAGHYSRPVAPSEGWFPTAKGDWVLLDDDKIAQVVVQTPGYVTLRKLGGATVMIPSSSFVEEPPTNLSHVFRVELEFGLDYGLQPESTAHVVETMRAWLTERLPAQLPEGSLRNLEVEFFAAGSSSLDYEIEVDLDGSAASEYEEVGRILSRLLVDCCNAHGWDIPFQQLQVHGVGSSAST